MKAVAIVFAGILILAAAAYGQGGVITINVLEGQWDDQGVAKLWPGQPAVFAMHYYNGTGGGLYGMTNGFLFSGGVGMLTLNSEADVDLCHYFHLVCQLQLSPSNPKLVTGSYSSMMSSKEGLPPGFDADVFTVTTQNLIDGDTICIDSSFYPPSGTWLWAPGGVPEWGGPYCWEVSDDCCQGEMRGDVDFSGAGPDVSDLVYMVNYMFNSGPGIVCMAEADFNDNGSPDISDLFLIVRYMFRDGPPLPPCP